MPDHVHLLVQAQAEDSDARKFVKAFKQYSGFHFKQRFGRPLWQRYGFERTLRDNEPTLSVARYILENPVRARLVRNPEDHPFSGSQVHSVAQIWRPFSSNAIHGPAEAGHSTTRYRPNPIHGPAEAGHSACGTGSLVRDIPSPLHLLAALSSARAPLRMLTMP